MEKLTTKEFLSKLTSRLEYLSHDELKAILLRHAMIPTWFYFPNGHAYTRKRN